MNKNNIMGDNNIGKSSFQHYFAFNPHHMYMIAMFELAIYSFFRGDIAMKRPRPLAGQLQVLNPPMSYISPVFDRIIIFLCKA